MLFSVSCCNMVGSHKRGLSPKKWHWGNWQSWGIADFLWTSPRIWRPESSHAFFGWWLGTFRLAKRHCPAVLALWNLALVEASQCIWIIQILKQEFGRNSSVMELKSRQKLGFQSPPTILKYASFNLFSPLPLSKQTALSSVVLRLAVSITWT